MSIYGICTSDFYKLSLRVFNEVRMPMHNFYRSKKMYNNFVHCFLLVYKERLNLSYRRFAQIATENNLQRMLCIKRIPHYTTLQKAMQRLPAHILRKMVMACRKLLNLKDVAASIDGTGFSNTNPSHYYLKRIDGKRVRNYTKTVFLADNKSKVILGLRTHSDNRNETLDFIPLVRELQRTLRSIVADKAYDSRKNRSFCREKGIEVHIPVRQYSMSRMQEFGTVSKKKALEKGFDEAKYRQRALIESINSAIKRKLGGYVCSRRADQQQKQVTLKALAYNLEIIGRKISSFFLYICGGFLHRH